MAGDSIPKYDAKLVYRSRDDNVPMERRVEHREVAADEAEMRLDRWFRRYFPDLRHVQLQKLLRSGQIRVDGARAKANQRLAEGQRVRVPPLRQDAATPGPRPAHAPRPVPADAIARLRDRVLYKDANIIAIDKPAGLAVQGGTAKTTHLDAMLDALRFGAPERPRLVHRLDQDTSGVLVLARTAAAARELGRLFKSRDVAKTYWAVVVGVPRPPEGRIDAPLAKRPGHAGERVVVDADEGKAALTLYRVLDAAGKRAALVELEPRTGRTHQLRAHMAALGTPILGDGKYGGRAAFLDGAELAKRLHLHARSITLPGVPTIVAPLPKHMAETFRMLGFEASKEA